MPVAPLDDNGTVVYYEDTGAPEGSRDYLTVVFLHGFIYYGGTCAFLVAFKMF